MERNNEGFTQMGSEGASWVGESIFSKRDHIFQNIGDGTYIHSGILSIRHAVAANTKMTFKILYNDAVALTGGQSLDGLPTVAQMSRQLSAEGVKKIAVIKFKGSPNDKLLKEKAVELERWIKSLGVDYDINKIRYAFYHGPMTPGFLRKNEVHIPIKN